MTEAEEIIAQLDLKPLPNEGGFFVQRWVSSERMADGRPAGTAIYFLLTTEGFSALHRMSTTEIWHFYAGCPVEHVQFSEAEGIRCTLLGPKIREGQVPQLIVPGGCWQGARLLTFSSMGADKEPAEPWALVGCTMSPGWDEKDFSLANRASLLQDFPSHAELIHSLTRAVLPNAPQPL